MARPVTPLLMANKRKTFFLLLPYFQKKKSNRSLCYKKIIKDKMTGRVDILWRIFEKIAKENYSHRNEKRTIFERFQSNLPKTMFFRSCDFNFNRLFSKMRLSISTLPVILSFMKFCVARTSLVKLNLDDVLGVILGIR